MVDVCEINEFSKKALCGPASTPYEIFCAFEARLKELDCFKIVDVLPSEGPPRPAAHTSVSISLPQTIATTQGRRRKEHKVNTTVQLVGLFQVKPSDPTQSRKAMLVWAHKLVQWATEYSWYAPLGFDSTLQSVSRLPAPQSTAWIRVQVTLTCEHSVGLGS